MNDNFQLLDDEDENGQQLIRLTSGPFSGIIYSYGRVNFLEEEDVLRVRFEFTVHENPVGDYDRKQLRDYIGPILIDLVEDNLLKNMIVYTGGTDENRTTNPDESNT